MSETLEEIIEQAIAKYHEPRYVPIKEVEFIAPAVRAWMEEQAGKPCKICKSIKVKTHCADCGWGDENNEAGDKP